MGAGRTQSLHFGSTLSPRYLLKMAEIEKDNYISEKL